MKDTLGIIMTDTADSGAVEALHTECAASLQIAGKYRLLDFTLSNMSNSGIERIGVVVSENIPTFSSHLSSGEVWNLSRKKLGLKLLFAQRSESIVKQIETVVEFLKASREKYVIISDGRNVFNADFSEILRFHKENRADITVMYTNVSDCNILCRSDVIEFDENGRLYSFERCPRTPSVKNISMKIYLLERKLLLQMAESAISRCEKDSFMNFFVKKANELRVFCYRFSEYSKYIGNAEDYYRVNMDMLDGTVRNAIFSKDRGIYTRTNNYAPTRYGESAEVSDSFVSEGCRINGVINRCVLFGGVRLEKGVRAENCIFMEKAFVGNNSCLEYVVLDRECIVRERVRLCGQQSFPVIIEKGAVI